MKSVNEFSGTLSKRLWGIDWNDLLPFTIANTNIRLELGNFASAASFMEKHFLDLYGEGDNGKTFISNEDPAAKATFYREMADILIFKDGTETVGIFVGNPTDWKTYYIRNISISKKYQNRGLFQSLLSKLFVTLEHTIDRIEIDISPGNTRQVHIMNKLGFITSGYQISERWGTILHLTKYLNPEFENVLYRQFFVGRKAMPLTSVTNS